MTTVKQVVEDVQLDVRRSIYLIQALSEKAKLLNQDVQLCLQNVNGINTSKETRKRSANLRELQKLTQLNALEEANYALESLKSIHQRVRDVVGDNRATELDSVKTGISFPLTPPRESEIAASSNESEIAASSNEHTSNTVVNLADSQPENTTSVTAGPQPRETRSRMRGSAKSLSEELKMPETETPFDSTSYEGGEKNNTFEKVSSSKEEDHYNSVQEGKSPSTNRRKRKRKSLFTHKKLQTAINEPRYCLCNDVYYGDMIGCDNVDCDREWFHYECVGLKTAPRGKWHCPKCSEAMRPVPQRRSQRLK